LTQAHALELLHQPARAGASRLADRFLHAALFVTTLAGILVFIEPSPYEAMFGILALACLAAGVTVERRVVPLLLLLIVWTVGGAVALIPVVNNEKSVTHLAISAYLSMTAAVYAFLFARDSLRRLTTLRAAYILAAVIVSALGIIGYFKLLPGADMFLENGRARGTFKDPNVFAPFLILPLLFLIQATLLNGLRLRHVLAGAIILMGLFLSFSRGAWAHFAGSAALMVLLMFVTAESARFRARIVAVVVTAAFMIAALVPMLLSFSSVRDMYTERVSLTQSYDTEHGGRFDTQAAGLRALPDYPNGVGPALYNKRFGQDPHNVYLNAFYSYGWIGGVSYATLVLLTLYIGLRGVLVRTPWQPYLVAVYATYVGVFCEGFIIDTDHWRHYFLLLGLVWGLAIASERSRPAQVVGSIAGHSARG
jgi:O-antigen ligase